ncbi:MAG: glycosyltransferase [Fibrobacter sp.]|jgi:glycosyltransferase involved in cell wall biosynthesis|nr:glycosyltransferase [Fibrobacter sp.]
MSNGLSIIVPVYNGEKYLDDCLASLVSVVNIELEIIVVNDGSTDNTAKLCDEWANKNPVIRVIHQDNQGVSASRNNGLKTASKEYIAFVDADDSVLPKEFEKAFFSFLDSKADLGFTSYFEIIAGTKKRIALPYSGNTLLHREAILEDFLPNRVMSSFGFMGACWRIFYRAGLLKENRIAFETKLKYHEDVLFVIHAVYASAAIFFGIETYYCYRQDVSGSASQLVTVNNLENRVIFFDKLKTFAEEKNIEASFALRRRKCELISKEIEFLVQTEHSVKNLFHLILRILDGVDLKDKKRWEYNFFGKSFIPFVFLVKYGFEKSAALYLLLRYSKKLLSNDAKK